MHCLPKVTHSWGRGALGFKPWWTTGVCKTGGIRWVARDGPQVSGPQGSPAQPLTRRLSALRSRLWRSNHWVRRKAMSVLSKSLPKRIRFCPRSSSSTVEVWRLSWASLCGTEDASG